MRGPSLWYRARKTDPVLLDAPHAHSISVVRSHGLPPNLALACAFRRSHCYPDKRQPTNYSAARSQTPMSMPTSARMAAAACSFNARYSLQQLMSPLESTSLNMAEDLLVQLGDLIFQKSQMPHREADQNPLGFAHSMTLESGLYLRNLLLRLLLCQLSDLFRSRLAFPLMLQSSTVPRARTHH